jgi:flagellar hook protein FlgE
MSFQQGLSGLNATSKNLDVIGNNVANANTFGAKASRAEFADMYATAMNGAGANAVGIGVTLGAVSQQFSQGNITTTANSLDLAINGAGFFQVSDGANPTMYSRNGQFKVDREGYLVNNQRQQLMGYPANAQGVIQPGQAVPLQLPTAGINPNPTSDVTMELNLDSRAEVTLPTSGPQIDFNDPTTYNNATSVTVYDQRGENVALTYYFQKASADQWNVYVSANGASVLDDGGSPAIPQPVVPLMQFDDTGAAPTSPTFPFSFDIPAGPTTALPITGVQLDLRGTTQYGSSFGVTDVTQNGFAPGQLSGIVVEGDGIVMARYSNGQSRPAGQIEFANFRNPQGLQPMGGNAWARTYASGDPILGTPGQGNMGVLQAGALEESNVDLTAELVQMMVAQRIYQANSQTIKTQDQVLQTLVNMR